MFIRSVSYASDSATGFYRYNRSRLFGMMAVNIKDISSTITLNDGVVMPTFGLGTYRIHSADIMMFALQNGYRMLDTAAFYEYVQFR